MDLSSVIKLVISILACFVAGGIGSLFTLKAIPGWYVSLKKPPYTPPNRVFGPVWTTLYILMGLSVFLIWQQNLKTNIVFIAFILFWVQLLINALWSVVFFGMKFKRGAVIIIVILWLLILATIITSFQISAWAGSLLIPYILWVSLALYLNIGVCLLNRGRA